MVVNIDKLAASKLKIASMQLFFCAFCDADGLVQTRVTLWPDPEQVVPPPQCSEVGVPRPNQRKFQSR